MCVYVCVCVCACVHVCGRVDVLTYVYVLLHVCAHSLHSPVAKETLKRAQQDKDLRFRV